jgi:hypothetical protein
MRRLLALLLVLSIAGVGLAWTVLDEQPQVEPGARITRDDLLWAKHLFERNVPRDRTSNTLQTLSLSEEELNRLLNYAVVVKPVSGVLADLEHDRLMLNVSLRVPVNPFGTYLNLTAEFAQQDQAMQLEAMQAGSLPLPSVLGRGMLWMARIWLERDPAYVALMQSVKRIGVLENHLNLDYQWRPELLTLLERKGAEVLVDGEEKRRLLIYADFVRETASHYPAKSEQPAYALVAQVFRHVQHRGGDVIAENRAAITALGAYVAGISLHQLLEGRGRSTRRAPSVLLTLHGRRDAAEHLLIAAAVSANGGSRLANALGLAKEEEDVVSGSGFSFTDLAFDRAGSRLGELVTGNHAAGISLRLAGIKRDVDLTPYFLDLPEFMPQTEFARRFNKVGSPAYLRQDAEIERRLAAHPLYQH